MKLKVEVSAGELFDKITILEIKLENIREADKLANIGREYAVLQEVINQEVAQSDELMGLRTALKNVNSELWQIEDAIRVEEKAGNFGPEFVALARSVYRTNDRRMAIKRAINVLLKSSLVEEKSYAAY
jgi:RNA binding exosome subunit